MMGRFGWLMVLYMREVTSYWCNPNLNRWLTLSLFFLCGFLSQSHNALLCRDFGSLGLDYTLIYLILIVSK